MENKTEHINYILTGDGETPASFAPLTIPVSNAGRITGWSAYALDDAPGHIAIEVLKASPTYPLASAPEFVSMLADGAMPSLFGEVGAEGDAEAWVSTDFAAGDLLRVKVLHVAGVRNVGVTLKTERGE